MSQVKHIKKSVTALAGLPLSGKTSVGERLAELTDATYLDVDVVRQEIAPATVRRSTEEEREIMLASYEVNHERALTILKLGKAAILGATYSWTGYHQMLNELSDEARAPLNVFLLQTPPDALAERIEKRRSGPTNSVVTSIEVHDELKKRYQAFPQAITLDSSRSVEDLSRSILSTLTELDLVED